MIDGIMSYIHKNDAAKHYPKIIQSFYNYPKILLKCILVNIEARMLLQILE
jgi:hypothetical protein